MNIANNNAKSTHHCSSVHRFSKFYLHCMFSSVQHMVNNTTRTAKRYFNKVTNKHWETHLFTGGTDHNCTALYSTTFEYMIIISLHFNRCLFGAK